jgi:hypothetical protein
MGAILFPLVDHVFACKTEASSGMFLKFICVQYGFKEINSHEAMIVTPLSYSGHGSGFIRALLDHLSRKVLL